MAEKHIADAEAQFHVLNVTPDFCQVGNQIIPFDISQVLAPEKVAYAKTVFARGQPVLLLDSVIKAVNGNAGKGVASGLALGSGDTKIEDGSSTVFIEGRKTARHLDPVTMNGKF